MNIFAVSNDPVTAASMLCDQHVVKMPLESAQMLSTVWHSHCDSPPSPVYKPSHGHHPCTLWAGKSTMNYQWLWQHAVALVAEHAVRYKRTKPHKSYEVLNALRKPPPGLRVGPLTPFAMAMPEQYKDQLDPVQSYRLYYAREKLGFATWKFCDKPWWLDFC